MSLLWFCLYALIVFSLRRILEKNKLALFAVVISTIPVFLFWIYRINVLFLPKLLGFRSLFWNAILFACFALLCLSLTKLVLAPKDVGQTVVSRRTKLAAVTGILVVSAFLCFRIYSTLTETSTSENQNRASHGFQQAAQVRRGSHDANAKAFLFDEKVKDAVIQDSAEPFIKRSIANFNFDGTDPIELKPVNEEQISLATRKGVLRIDVHKKVSPLETLRFRQPADEIFAIVIRLKLEKGKHFELWWKKAGDKKFSDNQKTRVIVAAQNRFLTFVIKTQTLQGWAGMIEGIRLYPTNQPDSSVELDFIHFLTGHEFFSGKVGTGTFEVNSELRRVIYTHSPSSVQYKVTVPQNGLLSFGMGIIDRSFPTDFKVQAADDREEREIFSRTIQDKNWSDAEVDLSSWQGRELTITFKTSSDQKGSLAFWSNPVLYAGFDRQRQPNILIYLIDCLRADHTTPYGYSRNTTPFLKEFSKEGLTFLNAYSQFTATRGSIASLFSSQYYSAHRTGVEVHERLSEKFQTIAEELRSHGYNTVSFLENVNAGPPGNLDQGFEQIFLKGLNAEGDRYGDVSAVRDWVERKINSNRSFFLYLHSLELHEPYEPPERYYKMYLPGLKGSVDENYRKYLRQESDRFMLSAETIDHFVGVYDGAINLADERFGEVIRTLKMANAYENTLIIVTADHGELFHEQRLWAHGGDPYQALIKVPLFMRLPSRLPKDKVIHEDVQLIDIAPTILDIVRDEPNSEFQGASLLPLIQNQNPTLYKDRSVFSEGLDWNGLAMNKFRERQKFHRVAMITDQWKIIAFRNVGRVKALLRVMFPLFFDFFRMTRNELYDLNQDPGEEQNLYAIDGERVKTYERRLNEWYLVQDEIRRRKQSDSADDSSPIDPEAQEELKALGYIR